METVISLFLMLGVFTFTMEMYSRSLNHLSRVDRQARATRFADNVMTEIRVWARDPDNFRSPQWNRFRSVSDPDFPGFEARTRVDLVEKFASTRELETQRPASRQVKMSETFKRVELEVLWDGTSLFEIATLLAEPARQPHATEPVVVTPLSPLGTGLPPEGTASFKAVLVDTSGEEIEDVKFSWSVEPVTGNGTITDQTRDGLEGTLTNVYIVPPGSRIYVPGTCRVVASAQYFGQTCEGVSPDVVMVGP